VKRWERGDEEEYVILNAKKSKENYENEDMGE
jgi:hypothetical protein